MRAAGGDASLDGVDVVAEWTSAQARIIELMAATERGEHPTSVPACPEWSPQDLLAHLVGFAADVTAGDEPDDHNDRWTARQVEARAERSVAELLGEWRGLTTTMQTWIRDNNSRPIMDITIHEQDLRGALGATGGQETDAAAFVRDEFAGRFATAVADLPVIELRGERWHWRSRDDAPVAVVVSAPDADLARGLISRRSQAQLRRWTVSGDIDPYLEHFAVLGALPEQDLTETFD